MTAGGHSPEHVMLYSAADNLILGGDQILAKISPNVSVEAMDPDGDPLGIYLRSLKKRLKRTLPRDVLVLPGHNLPFVGLATRADELIAHHEARCMAILEACKDGAQTVADLVPVIFGRPDRRPASARLRLRRGAGACECDGPQRAPARGQCGQGADTRSGVRRPSRSRPGKFQHLPTR